MMENRQDNRGHTNASIDHTSRKSEHLKFTEKAQVELSMRDQRFSYEPLLSGNFNSKKQNLELSFLGKTLKFPLWISSMTGGTEEALKINHNMARACKQFGLGMGLGSCRQILENSERIDDFAVRAICGDNVPLFANIGIGQLVKLIEQKRLSLLQGLVRRLDADGLIIHINPLQEYIQPEGDRYEMAPTTALSQLFDFLGNSSLKIIVKEVGQGMGPLSLRELFKLPISGIELAAFGGTNFSSLEQLREKNQISNSIKAPFVILGHSPKEMINWINQLKREFKQSPDIIISGGVQSALDAFYYRTLCESNCVYGLASRILEYARGDYETLETFLKLEIEAYKLCTQILKVSEVESL